MSDVLQSSLVFGDVVTWLAPMGNVAAGTVGAVVALALVCLALRLVIPRIYAVAWTTAKESLSQPLFWVMIALGTAALLFFPFVPYNTMGEDIKVLKDGGLTLIMIMATIQAVWTASQAVSEEIEGRVALTVLAKPIGRAGFIIGKFLGVLFPIAVMFIILGAIFLVTVSFKVVYDAREMAETGVTQAECWAEVVQILPGLPLAFMEATVLASIALAISTRLPLVPNLIICAAIYVLGNLLPTIGSASAGANEITQFFAQLLAVILPVLDNFNIYTAISEGRSVPWSYVGWTAVFCVLYSGVALLFALLLFEDRDLA